MLFWLFCSCAFDTICSPCCYSYWNWGGRAYSIGSVFFCVCLQIFAKKEMSSCLLKFSTEMQDSLTFSSFNFFIFYLSSPAFMGQIFEIFAAFEEPCFYSSSSTTTFKRVRVCEVSERINWSMHSISMAGDTCLQASGLKNNICLKFITSKHSFRLLPFGLCMYPLSEKMTFMSWMMWFFCAYLRKNMLFLRLKKSFWSRYWLFLTFYLRRLIVCLSNNFL